MCHQQRAEYPWAAITRVRLHPGHHTGSKQMLLYQNNMHWGWIRALSIENLMVLIMQSVQMLAVRVWPVLHGDQHAPNGLGLLGCLFSKLTCGSVPLVWGRHSNGVQILF